MLFWEMVLFLFLVIASFGYAFGTVYRSNTPVPRWAAALAVVCVLVLWLRGELRWQLYPACGLAVFFLVLSFVARDYIRLRRASWLAHVAVAKLLAIAVVFCVFLAWALPVVTLPAPTGPHAIGTASYYFQDTARKEIYTEDAEDTREIMAQVWYPAAPEPGADPARWLPDLPALAPIITQNLVPGQALPSFMLDHLTMVQSNAYADAPVAGDHERFPVIIYSHGWTGFRTVAADECEALASHGYVVFAPDHSYGAMGTVFPDGRVAVLNRKAMPPDEPADARQAGIELLVDTYAGDVRLLIDLIYRMNAGELASPFAGRLDLDRLGLFGHSTGGGAITEVYLTDARVKAAVGLDPWVEPVSPELRGVRVDKPYLSLRSEGWIHRGGANTAILNGLLANFGSHSYDWYLAGSTHEDFTLLPLLSPVIGWLGRTGPIAPYRGLEVTDAALAAFFDTFLRNQPVFDFDDPGAAYPELIVTPEGQ